MQGDAGGTALHARLHRQIKRFDVAGKQASVIAPAWTNTRPAAMISPRRQSDVPPLSTPQNHKRGISSRH
jgi:hypothetical protein